MVKDKVIVGGSGGDNAHRGYLTAFYAKTGRLAWRWYVIPGPGEKGHETWKGDSWKIGGGSPWMTGSFDPELNLVYWGTGNAAGDFYDGDRDGARREEQGRESLHRERGGARSGHRQAALAFPGDPQRCVGFRFGLRMHPDRSRGATGGCESCWFT